MVDSKKQQNTADDPRLAFMCSYIMKTMRLKADKWQKMITTDDSRDIVMEFLVSPVRELLVITVNNAGVLTALQNFPAQPKGKTCFFIRKTPVALTDDNLREILFLGDISARPIDDLSVLVDAAFIPIINNPNNQIGWPQITIQNVCAEFQVLRNIIAEVRGHIVNQTILPMPITIDAVMKMADQIDEPGDFARCTLQIKNSLENIVLKWSKQVTNVLHESPRSIFTDEHDPNPLPVAEFEFWNSRLSNLEHIFAQLCDSRVKIIARVLERIDSVYFSAFRETFRNVVEGLHEARDITLWQMPLRKHVDTLDITEFDEIRELLRPLVHVVTMVWANSSYFNTSEHMLRLFQLVNNQLIACASKTLDPGSIFQGDVDEALRKIDNTIDNLLYFKQVFDVYKSRLTDFATDTSTEPLLWSFSVNAAFERFDAFVVRLDKIRLIFTTARDFLKLEKVEIAGIKGTSISRSLNEIYEQFNELYRGWSNITFDPLDPNPVLQHFSVEYRKFDGAADQLERKLAFQFQQAFDECTNIEQIVKLFLVLGNLVQRPVILPLISQRYTVIVDLYGQELDKIKSEFDVGLKNVSSLGFTHLPVEDGLPDTSGFLMWLFQLRQRLMKSSALFEMLDYPIFENELGDYTIGRTKSMLQMLDELRDTTFVRWCKTGVADLEKSLAKSLLERDDRKLLVNNFDKVLVTIEKDIKILKLLDFAIPDELLQFIGRQEELWKARMSLSRIIEWYNAVRVDTKPCEFALVERELKEIDDLLEAGITITNWNTFEQGYIDELYERIKDLCTRVRLTQFNIQRIVKSIQQWGDVPLFTRKDNNTQALLDIENRGVKSQARFQEVITTKILIEEVMDENFRNFFNLFTLTVSRTASGETENVDGETSRSVKLKVGSKEDTASEASTAAAAAVAATVKAAVATAERTKKVSQAVDTDNTDDEMAAGAQQSDDSIVPTVKRTPSQLRLFRDYEIYVDEIVSDQIMAGIQKSLKYIKFEMENRLENNSALFDVKMELQPPHMVFFPNISLESDDGFLRLIELLIIDIYNMCDMIPRVAQPPEQDRIDEQNVVYEATYESILRDNKQIDDMRNEILSHVKGVLLDANKYFDKFKRYAYLWTDIQSQYLDQFLKYGRPLTAEEVETLGTEDFKVKEAKPTLAMFQSEIDRFRVVREDISKIYLNKVFRIWFRVDMRGFRNSLLNYATKWQTLFKSYLTNQVIDRLQNLEDFIQVAIDILGIEVTQNEFEKLLRVLAILNQVAEREIEAETMFDHLKDMVEMLREYDVEFDDNVHSQFATLPEQWKRVKKMSLNVKQQIAPIQAYQVDMIEKRIVLFGSRLKIYRNYFFDLPFFTVPCDNVYEICDRVNSELLSLENQFKMLSDSAALFELSTPEANLMHKCRREVKNVKQLWDFVQSIESCIDDWKTTPWKRIDVEVMDQECKKFGKDLRSLPKDMRQWQPYLYIEAKLKNLMTSLRAVTELQNPAIRERHWIELMAATKVRFEMDDSTTMADLLDLNLYNYEEDVRNIVDKSMKEMGMEKILKELAVTWKSMVFEYDSHERTKLNLLKVSEELVEVLEENQVQLQNLLSSKYIAFFLTEVTKWQTLLSNADQVINLWFEVQRKWMYLESIFIGSEDIRKQLPIDSQRFATINQEFKALIGKMGNNVVEATNKPGLATQLESLLAQLVLCEKALNDYLETKRLAYPRFYFVSSSDLLDILSNGNQPELVGRHLTKLYDSLAKLKIAPATKEATGMVSKENEEFVPFKMRCDCTGQVENWLNRVTDTMRATLRDLFGRAVNAYEEKPREKWVFDWPAQPALCTTQIWWTVDTNTAFARLEEGYENALKDYQKKQIAMLNALIVLLLGDLTQGDRQKIMTICTIDVHSRDVVAKMIAQKIENGSSFQWQSQLRHRWDHSLHDCFANICDAQFKYDYEYLGNTPRLVITPLTDRCYITLTQSLHLVMGGAPAGPAGTGKTETTKDLGRALGIMVYVFNCSEQMDYKSCGNIHKGLAQTGAWGCFDEFNRISVEVLSVVAVQVKSIQDAIKTRKKVFTFMGESISLIPTVGMFITMNPGYAGRTELPENLKALYRPCAMVVPDFALICEIMLVAEGFQEARLLARKFITLYTLCKELLSKQDHYDWGLRAIKSVLVVAGSLKRGDRLRPEDQVLMRALRDFNIPKIVTDDVPVFMGLIGDLFPALDVPRKRVPEFEELIKKSSSDLKLQPEDGFVLKVVQLEELFAVRHSVFIVGNAGTGKSQVWKTLFRTYHNQKRKPYFNDLNPKAVTNDELFGIINPATREWKDGLFSIIMRDQANMAGTGPKWIVLDGDIDPMWIESLNTLMDDNKVLTLASNERIALTKDMRLLFEIASLKTATPATVSRAGILYINPQDLGWNPYVATWIDTRESQTEQSTLNILFDKYIPPLLEVGRARFKKITPISEIAMIQMSCFLLDCLLTPQNVPPDCPKEWYEIYFTFAVIWGFGSALFQDQLVDWRNEFNKWWINEFKTVKYPTAGTIFNYYIDATTKKFHPWTELVVDFELDTDIPLQSTLVNTAETTRLRYFMDILVDKKHPVMLVGGAGSGKSVIVADKLNNLSDLFGVTNVPFNFYTNSEILQKILEKPLEKKAGRNFGPPGNKSMIYFIDDMNMPEVDTYGTVQPHTLIRQFIDYQHWYDRQKFSLKDIHKCQLVACMNPTAGSFTINPRLQRHFCAFAVSFPSGEALFHIYNSILSQHLGNPLNKFAHGVPKICETLIRTAVTLHQRVGQTFLPTAVKFHYIFNLRDMANIFQGMLFANGETCRTATDLVRLWVHESTRVYGDKLVNFTDIDTFNKLVRDTTKKGIEEDLNEEHVFAKPLIYCHFAESLVDPKYMPCKSNESLAKLLEEAQTNYNELVGAMNLVLFDDAIGHVCRISRILEAPRGYALLIGVGGSGKQSLTRLAAFISSLDVVQIQLRKGYSIADLKIDLATLYMKAGIKSVPSCFLMTDSQVAEEQFLVVVNDMLASGEIPELFADDEIDNIVNAVRNEVKQAGILDNKENCWKYFIEKVRRTVKVVLCFSPVGSTLRVRARKFPAVVNCTAINWFHEWPADALVSVSERFLSEIDELPGSITKSVATFMAHVHRTVNDMSHVYLQNEKRYNYTTPKSFLELIALYTKLLIERSLDLKERIVRLENGLLKLVACSKQVDSLQEQLVTQEIELKVKNQAADKLVLIVSEENEKVQKEKNIAAEEGKKVSAIEDIVSAKAAEAAEDLRKAEPMLLKAEKALDTLNKTNLTELKSFGSPPDAVVNVTAAVLVLLSKGKIPKDRSWKACKAMMNKVDQFLNNLINYDKENIHPNIITALLPYIQDKEFNGDIVMGKSSAAGGLCFWVINIYNFYGVYLDVEPKQRALREAQATLKNARDTVEFLNHTVEVLQSKLDVIQADFDAALAEKQKYQAEAEKTANTIDLAHRLVNGLVSENIRWRESVKSFQAQSLTLPGDVLLVSCFISYVGCFSRTYRLQLQKNMWLPTFEKITPQIPVSKGIDPLEMLCDDAQIAQWNNEGLPSDRMSAENAIILTNSARWPLMIDPQLQGIKWIKQKYGDKLIILRLSTKGYLEIIERAVSGGQVILIENIGESVDAVLDPILGRQLIKKGRCLKIGDKEIDYNANFKLILQTKLANPHYKPEMQAQTTLINFTVTRDGLEEQLLAEVVKAERPDLENLKATLTMQQNNFKIVLKELEDDLLNRLSSAGEDVLEDPTLVLNLEKTKHTAADVEIKVREAKITSTAIDEAREHYRIAAERASILYFILNDLHKINPIYQFSLKAFTIIFQTAIEQTAAADLLKERVLNLVDSITFCVYMYTSRGLFESDKLIFMAQMAIQILLQAKEIDAIELDFLLRFPYTPNLMSPLDFLTGTSWGGIKALSQLPEFRNLDRDIEGSVKRWKNFVESECPEKEKYPGDWKNKNALQRLCIMRALRPDRMTYAVSAFIEEKLGSRFVEARMVEFAKSFEETSSTTPVFFILSPGVDPLKDVEKLGKKMKFSTDHGNFYNVSLGQGQEVIAEAAIDVASVQGFWVILQNIHLVAKWLPTLEKKIEATQENSHNNYRLFVSAEPAASAEYHIIPQGILESAIKITNEPPTGMLANLHKALDNFNQETLEMCTKEAEFKVILFSLCYFHAVVAERRKFGPQGWNRVYPFNVGDLTISVYVLFNYLEANTRVPWEDLRYLFGEIMYGGHITDDWDRRLCRTYLDEFMQPALVDGDLFLSPGFLAPPNTDYVGYHSYIDETLPAESPYLYGLHPNAEIGFLTTTSEKLFKTIFDLQPRDSGASVGASVSREEVVRTMIEDILDKLPEEFHLVEMMARIEDRTPFIIVAFQECERMNILVGEIKRSLQELFLGLKGELTITPDMENLEMSLFYDEIPEFWTKRAYPSLLGLQSWFADLMLRVKELETWTADFNLPSSVWLAGFFNPQSFLTAIMQQTARKNEWPLDKMSLNCDVTKKSKEEISAPPREGAFVNGLFMEGARWDSKMGTIADSLLKELFPSMPVIYIKAVTQDKQDTKNVYECPVYKIRMRGPTFVWTFNLKTKQKAAKWILAGVCLLLQT